MQKQTRILHIHHPPQVCPCPKTPKKWHLSPQKSVISTIHFTNLGCFCCSWSNFFTLFCSHFVGLKIRLGSNLDLSLRMPTSRDSPIICPARRDLKLGVLFSVHNGDAQPRCLYKFHGFAATQKTRGGQSKKSFARFGSWSVLCEISQKQKGFVTPNTKRWDPWKKKRSFN